MKFSCNKIALQNSLQNAWIVLGKKTGQNKWILIEADQETPGVRFKASSYFAYYCETIKAGAHVQEIGQIKVWAPTFKSIIDSLSSANSDTVLIYKTDSGNISISCGSAKFEVGSTDPLTFPKLKGVASYHEVEVNCEAFRAAGSRVVYIQSNKVPVVDFRFKDKKLRICATDTHRLAMDEIDIESDIEDSFQLAHHSLAILLRVANSKTGKFTLGWNDDDVIVEYDDTIVEVHRNSIPFPNVDMVMQTLSKNPLEARFNTTELASVLGSLSIFHDEKNVQPLRVEFTGNTMKLSIRNPEAGRGSGRWEIPCEFNGEGPFKIQFNPRFMSEFTKGVLGSDMRMYLKDGVTPVLMKLEDCERATRETCENMTLMLSPMMG